MVRFGILGPVEALVGERRVAVGGPRQVALLAFLLVHANQAVSVDQLIDGLWSNQNPAGAVKRVQVAVARLRKAVGSDDADGESPLRSTAGGYLLAVAPGLLDAEVFSARIGQGREALASGDAAQAAEVLRGALSLWRGPPLAEVAYESFAQGEIRRLEELRLTALETRVEADLQSHRHSAVIGELEALLAAQPTRERFAELLMLALYRCGRQADALNVYQRARARLAAELGLEPGPALSALQQRILEQDPRLEPPRTAEAAPTPPDLAAWAQAGEERKLITVLAAEFVIGGAHLDPELLRAMLAPIQARVRAELARFGGSVDQFVGGSALAVFGVPVAHEDDPNRAVRAGLRVLELVREVGPDLPGPEVETRVGVATGEALVGAPGPEESLAQGEVVLIALALQRAADAGTVVVDEATTHSSRGAIEFEELVPLRLGAGRSTRPVWRARSAAPWMPAALAATPFVGRQRELAMLETICATVVDEQMPRLVAIVGEAGIGKTRLTDELILRMGREMVVYRGRCLSYGEGIVYWPLREILWAAAGILLDEPAAAADAKLQRIVEATLEDGADAGRTAAALARTAGVALADDRLEGMTPESVVEEVGLAWPRFLGALAGRCLTVVVIEDLHWAEAPLLDLLERLVSRSTGRLLMVVTARPEFAAARPSWSSTPGMVQIGLERLSDAQSRELIANLLPDMSADVRERVAAPAEGNPFFTEELARHVAERVQLADSSGIEGMIPNSIRALVAARIDSLPEPEKRTLHDAAVVGRTFWATTLESIAGGGSAREMLRALEAKGFIVANATSVLPGQVEFSFRHALKRDVAYRSIPRAVRCRSHAAVAHWIEEVVGDRHPEFVELLANHYEAAANPQDATLAWPEGSPEREQVRGAAVEALIGAAAAARERLAFEQAVGLADRARSLAATDAERLASVELRASALHAAVRCDEALAAYLAALDLACKLGDKAAYSRLRAHAVLLCARYTGAFASDAWRAPVAELVERGLEDVGETTLSFEAGALLIARAEMSTQWFSTPTGHEGTVEDDLRRAVEIAEAIDSPYLLSHAVDALTDATLRRGFCTQGELAERLITISATLPDPAEAHDGLVSASISFTYAGQYARARELARLATRDAAGLGPHHEVHAAAAEAMSLIPAGRFAELLEVAARVPKIAREEDYRCGKAAVALAGYALTQFERGDRNTASKALALLEEQLPGQPRWRAIDMVRPVAGLDRVQRAVASLGNPPGRAIDRLHTLRLDLQLTALAGDWAAVDRLVAEARAVAGRACAPVLRWIADWAQAVALAAAGDGTQAAKRATRAAGALQNYGEPYTGARLLVDLLPFLDLDLRTALAEETAKRLNAMGALASATEAVATLGEIAR